MSTLAPATSQLVVLVVVGGATVTGGMILAFSSRLARLDLTLLDLT